MGKRRKQWERVLRIQRFPLDRLNQGNDILKLSILHPTADIWIPMANSLWVAEDHPLNNEYTETIRKYYGGQVFPIDFQSPNAPDRMNNWISQNTGGLIPDMVQEIDPQTVTYLFNTILFSAPWTMPFPQKDTKDSPFTLLDGNQAMVSMMAMKFEEESTVYYLETKGFQAVNISFGINDSPFRFDDSATATPDPVRSDEGRISMYVFLPKESSSLEEFYANLNASNWNKWMKGFLPPKEGYLEMPRFAFDNEIDLAPALKSLGMGVIFDRDRADFGKMSSRTIWVDEIRQRASINLDETGADVAAVTSERMIEIVAALSSLESFRMIVDRPFFFAIRDNRTGTILFMGSVVDPRGD
jgi:serpin B